MFLPKIHLTKKYLLSVLVLVLLFGAFGSSTKAAVTSPSNSATEYTLLEPLPCIPSPAVKDEKGVEVPGTEVKCGGVQMEKINFQTYVQYAFNLLIALAAVAAVLMIVYGGFQYMTSDAYSTKSEGLKRMENAIYGLLLVLSSYLILKTIDPRLVKIPSTLVVPLEIKYDTSDFEGFFSQLSKDADKYQIQGQKFVEEAQSAKADITKLQQQRQELQSTLETLKIAGGALGSGDPQIQMLAAQIQNLDNEIKKTQTTMVVSLAKSIIDNGGVSQILQNMNRAQLDGTITGTGIKEQVANGQAFIDQTVKTRSDQLKEVGAYDQINNPGGVVDYGNAEKLSLRLAAIKSTVGMAKPTETFWNTFTSGYGSSAVDVFIGSENIGSIQKVSTDLNSQIDAISQQISTIKDPALARKLQGEVVLTQSLLNTKLKPPKK